MHPALELKYFDQYDISKEQHIANDMNSLNQGKRKRQELVENE